jgi:hypothetical protein
LSLHNMHAYLSLPLSLSLFISLSRSLSPLISRSLTRTLSLCIALIMHIVVCRPGVSAPINVASYGTCVRVYTRSAHLSPKTDRAPCHQACAPLHHSSFPEKKEQGRKDGGAGLLDAV